MANLTALSPARAGGARMSRRSRLATVDVQTRRPSPKTVRHLDAGSTRVTYNRRPPMKRSVDRILTTHTGSLIRPPKLLELVKARQAGKAIDQSAYEATLEESVREV